MYFEFVGDYVDCIPLAVNGDQCWTVLDTD